LTQAVADVGRPYPNVARVAINIGLNFSIDPKERGKAASLLKKTATKPAPKLRGRPPTKSKL
jgi:hypothetical protein